ncbi:MAG TPA: hypothetical protein VMV70_02590 [Gallionella sp.]|nr:hypothetical protein [Gallionella sp.]
MACLDLYRLIKGGFDRDQSEIRNGYGAPAHIQQHIPDVSFAYSQFTEVYGGPCLCSIIFYNSGYVFYNTSLLL